jgi:Arm DNA-binding domain
MARPRRDGLPSRKPNKRKFTDHFLKNLAAEKHNYLAWDTRVSGLAVSIHPTGNKTWKVIYPFGGRTRWYTIGKVDDAIDLAAARKLAAQVLLKAASGVDAQAERRAARSQNTFAELADAYRDQHAKKKNRSWRQADTLVRRFLIPRWGKLQATAITRSDVSTRTSKTRTVHPKAVPAGHRGPSTKVSAAPPLRPR